MSLGSYNGQILLGFRNKEIKIISIETGEVIKEFETLRSIPTKVSFSPDEKYIITWGSYLEVGLFNRETGEMVDSFQDQGWLVLGRFDPALYFFPCNLKLEEALDDQEERTKFLTESEDEDISPCFTIKTGGKTIKAPGKLFLIGN